MAKFWSKYAEFCLSMGTVTRKTPGSAKDLEVAKTIKFARGQYETEDKDEIAALREAIKRQPAVLGEHNPQDSETLNRILEAQETALTKTKPGQGKRGSKKGGLSSAFSAA